MIVDFDTVVAFVGTEDILYEYQAVDAALKKACRREFEETAYFLDRYDGTGKPTLYLRQYPVTVFSYLSIGTDDVIKVWNTTVGVSASVSVSATGLSFEQNGTALTPITFAVSTTMTSIVSAINLMGNGWNASLIDVNYATYPSKFLLKRWGASCIDSNYVYLQMPYRDPEDEYELDENRGVITLGMGTFPKGKNNVFASYTAGYPAENMPEDLKFAVCAMVKYTYQRRDEELWNVQRYRVGEIDITFGGTSVPSEVQDVVAKYKRYMI